MVTFATVTSRSFLLSHPFFLSLSSSLASPLSPILTSLSFFPKKRHLNLPRSPLCPLPPRHPLLRPTFRWLLLGRRQRVQRADGRDGEDVPLRGELAGAWSEGADLCGEV